MSDLQKKLNKVISDIEKNLKNKEDLEYVKTQIYNIYTIFLDEFDEIESKYNERMENILIKCKVLDDRMNEIEDSIEKIESDIYVKVNEEFDFDVICPYCDAEFSVEPPMFVELEVTYTEPGFSGNTTTTSGKPATLENGYEISVPLFINIGDVIKIDTRTGEYMERV